MDFSLAVLGSLAAAMALESAPDPDPPATPDAPCEETKPAKGKHAKPSCENKVDGVTIEGKKSGATESPLEPDMSFDETAIKSFGAATVGELLTSMGPLLRSGRGRDGNERPEVLINGQRTSGFQEAAAIPTEALVRMDRLKEEAALPYGFRADQVVLNIILKKQFHAWTARADAWRSTAGGRAGTEPRLGVFKTDEKGRLTAEIRYRRDSPLFEQERGIVRAAAEGAPYDLTGNVVAPSGEIDPALSALAGAKVSAAAVPSGATAGRPALADFAATAGRLADDDLTFARSLTARQEEGAFQGAYTRNFGTTTATLSGSAEIDSRVSYRGLSGAAIPIATGSPYSPFANDVILYRYLGDRDALRSRTDIDKLNAGVLLRTMWSGWRVTFTGNLDRTDTASRIGRGVDVSAFRAAVAAGTVNPFGSVPSDLLSQYPQDTADSVATNLRTELNATGTVAHVPAGSVRVTLNGGADRRRIEAESVRSGVRDARVLTRDRATAYANIDLPLTRREGGPLPALGNLSLNGNLRYERFSDIGGLVTAGGGLNWSPVKGLSILASYSFEEGEPSLERLNNPVVVTSNASMYDFANGTSVLVNVTSGGNPNLSSDQRRLTKLSLTYKPFEKRELTLNANLVTSRIDDQIGDISGASPELEAAFPERFTRDATGRLLAVDMRPVNFAFEDKQELSWNLTYWRKLGATAPSKPGSVAFLKSQGYFSLSLDHTWRLKDEVMLRRGAPSLDLLDGASLGRRGGTARHEVSLMSSFSYAALGGFGRVAWKSATRVNGGAGVGDLRFSATPTVMLQGFVDLGDRPELARNRPWLKGSRLTLSVDNVFDTHPRVKDSQGRTPLAYQPGYMDPIGRQVRLGLKKMF